MNKTIPVPELLQDHIARTLNTEMLEKNQCFVFLGEPEVLINRTPATYVDAFDMYVNRLYVLYHDYGMKFLMCYGNEAARIINKTSYISHIFFVNRCRAALSHADDPTNEVYIFRALKKYYFKNDMSFLYNDWLDFWKNAPENHWEKLVRKIVDDSNLVLQFLQNVALQEPTYSTIYESISDIFKNKREFTDNSRNRVDIYISSFDSRFLKLVCSQLLDTVGWIDKEKAKQELRNFYNLKLSTIEETKLLSEPKKMTPHEMREELIKRTLCSLKNNDYTDSELLYLSVIQNVKLLIEDQLKKDSISEADDFLDP